MPSQQQEHAAVEWAERWQRIKACTDPADREKAQSGIAKLYRAVGGQEPTFLWFDSPLALMLSHMSWELGKPGSCLSPWVPRRLAPASLDESALARLEEERQAKHKQILALHPPSRGGRVAKEAPLSGLTMKGPMYSLIRRADFPRAPVQISDSVAPVVQRALHDWLYLRSAESYCVFALWHCGQHEVSWVADCQWARDAAGYGLTAEENQMLDAWIAIAESCGWWLPLEFGCLVCERPERIEISGSGMLHCEQGPAAQFRDSCAVWALNGVAVPQWLVETPVEQIEPRRVVEIDNASIRREFVRKVGMERICHALSAACMDKQGDYELLLLDLGNGRRRPFLKMLNPSIGTWHIEGVDASCQTVDEALTWRNGTSVKPTILT